MMFSIIVPVYKVEKYLSTCVNTLINQTYSDIEIILVDDGSPDNCPKMCDEFALKDSRIKVIHKKNGGLSDARNAGINAAAGRYIIFVDSDDYIELDSCEKLSKFAQKNVDIIVADAYVEGSKINLSHIPASDTIYSGMEYFKKAFEAGYAPMAGWLNVFRREYLLENNLFFKKGILHEDEEFTPRAFIYAKRVIVSGIYFYHYIIREDSITTQKNKRKNATDLFDTCLYLEKIYGTFTDKNLKKLALDSLSRKYLSMFQTGKLYQYGKEYLHKDFVLRNAFVTKTRIKALLYVLSPKLYYKINSMTK